MSEPVIEVRHLGKAYRLGRRSPDSFREAVFEKVRAGARRLLPRPSESSRDEEFWALRDLSFDVRRGDVLGIIGHNGAGKSTLLKLLSRITEPTAGSIRIRGRVASLLEVGTGFHPELSGRENIFLNGAILGMSRAEVRRRFDEIVEYAEVGRFLDTPVKRYSSGMYVRLAFAVAAHLEPEVLIVDEVLSVGDAAFQKKCLGTMRTVAGDGRTVLFVSHSMTAVSQLCTRALILERGRVEASGDDVEALVGRYLATAQSAQQAARVSGDSIIAAAEITSVVESPSPPGWIVTFDVAFGSKPRPSRIGIDFSVRHNELPLGFGGSAYFSTLEVTEHVRRVRCAFGPLNYAVGTYQIDLRVCLPMERWLEEHDAMLEFSIGRQAGSPHMFHLDAGRDLGLIVPVQQWSEVQ